jgi:2-octaprenylphenol hydroxylase|tara:strand:- start:864 stop:2006 length:1143 start_codon:yes stop_codon:yes gene_type:complete
MENKKIKPIIVLGSGVVAGLTSKMLVNNGFEVIRVINQMSKPLNKIFAISPSSMTWFKSIGLPNFFISSGYPIKKIDIYYEDEQESLRFDLDEYHKSILAFMVKEKDLLEAVDLSLNESSIKFLYQDKIILENHDNYIKITNNEEDIYSNICIWCDGSNLDDVYRLKIKKNKKDFGQQAITFNFIIDGNKANHAKQYFFDDSILALLPISENEMSVVWSCDDKLTDKFRAYDDESFISEFISRTNFERQFISNIGERNYFPIKQAISENLFVKRILLIGDAAHTIHPMAGQGLNLGIRDIINLQELIKTTKYTDIGLKGFLRKYERSRRLDIEQFSKLTTSLQWLFSSPNSVTQKIIRKGLKLVNNSSAIKNFFIKKATT